MSKYPLNGEFVTEEDDIEMFVDYENWPRWPVLPVKRTVDGQRQHGVMTEGGPPLRVYLVTMFEIDRIGEAEFVEYESPVAASEDGWMVD